MVQLPVSALIDSSTQVLLTLDTYVPALAFVAECTMDVRLISWIQFPNYPDTEQLLAFEPSLYSENRWDYKSRTLIKTYAHLLTDHIRAKSHLAHAKKNTIHEMIVRVNAMRAPMDSGLYLQEYIYLGKQLQAQRLKDSNFDENILKESSYVSECAQRLDITIEKAADLILSRAHIDHEFLTKTERLRSEYFDRIKNVQQLDELPEIRSEFFSKTVYLL